MDHEGAREGPEGWAQGMVPGTGARVPAAPGAGVETMCYPGARRPPSQAGGGAREVA